MTGTVVRLWKDKSYGFVKRDESSDEYFFHRQDFVGHWDDLCDDFVPNGESLKVEFTADQTPKGKRARNVARLDWPNQSSTGI